MSFVVSDFFGYTFIIINNKRCDLKFVFISILSLVFLLYLTSEVKLPDNVVNSPPKTKIENIKIINSDNITKKVVTKNMIRKPDIVISETNNNVEDLVKEMKYTSKKWNQFLKDSFIHVLNLNHVTVTNYYDLVRTYSKPFQKLTKAITKLKAVDSNKVVRKMDELISLRKEFQMKREEILGKKNIEFINKIIIPDFNRVYGNQSIIKSF